MKSKLFIKRKEGTGGQQLILFPYLGGSESSFVTMVSELDDQYEIWVANPPGHLRSEISLVEDMNQLVDLYYEELKKIVTSEYYLFGHSMGGNVAYFLARKLCSADSEVPKPRGIILSASGSPKIMAGQNYSQWEDDQLLEKIKSYCLLPPELEEEIDILQAFIPMFRADYKVLESGSRIAIADKLELPAYLMWGEKDTVEPVEYVVDWLRYFTNKLVVFPIKDGYHMFINSHVKEVCRYVEQIMAGCYEQEDDDF